MQLSWLAVASYLCVASSFAAAAVNPGIPVHLRIEGERETIFEGDIFTRGHNVTTPSGGTHPCNGLNDKANTLPGATCTSALADAARRKRFTFDGTFDPTFDDFFITAIGDSVQTATQFWGILVNFQFTPVGGCQQEVRSSDEVLFAFDAFSKTHFLKLSGPRTAIIGKPAKFTVIDGMNGEPVAGASVNDQTSGADGTVLIDFTSRGTKSLKASKFDSIRSNAVEVIVV
ncbi:hypothetical protein HYPSUDRAFT_852724 [Hypholoma sublateritium FD-334 SS-4]|uniref:Uncharacterized protein n=1 Tax=Hypholoma sublateritium (strain FD-334 SS-4) TaxID=945553 RepID=A0A0D2KZF5_HYPSF|nr:hypothetical protein HYPSUDRAFT_852724 [Hypholoma sublateritium FD-334 SS-4]